MSVIILDGPEKAGKSTIASLIVKEFERGKVDAELIHWGPVTPDDRAYTELLQKHTGNPRKIYVWDRGWPSEYVYGKLLHRDRRMVDDPWLGAWLHDRAVQAGGLRVMLYGPSAERLRELRSNDDLLVDPADERRLYGEYAKRFGWLGFNNAHGDRTAKAYAAAIIAEYRREANNHPGDYPPFWAGPWSADVVFVGEKLSDKVIPGGWLPFTSQLTTKLGRLIGDAAMKFAWVNAHNCSPRLLRNRRVLVACGATAQTWVQNYVKKGDSQGAGPSVVNIPHPSYMFRFKNSRTALAIDNVKAAIEELV